MNFERSGINKTLDVGIKSSQVGICQIGTLLNLPVYFDKNSYDKDFMIGYRDYKPKFIIIGGLNLLNNEKFKKDIKNALDKRKIQNKLIKG